YLLFVDQLAHRTAAGIHEIGVRLHGDAVADLTYLQDNRLAGQLVDGELNALLDVGGETGLVDHELVGADGQAREEETAIVGRIGAERESCFRVADSNFGRRHGSAGGVGYGSAEACSGVLRICHGSECQCEEYPTICHILHPSVFGVGSSYVRLGSIESKNRDLWRV